MEIAGAGRNRTLVWLEAAALPLSYTREAARRCTEGARRSINRAGSEIARPGFNAGPFPMKAAMTNTREWVNWAIGRIEADFNRSADTHLIPLPVPALPISRSISRTSRISDRQPKQPPCAVPLWPVRQMDLRRHAGGRGIERQAAVTEAYFARMLGLRFIAVVPRNTAQAKIDAIAFYGGECHFVDAPGEVYAAAQSLADELQGHYIDQFTYAERATDWRSNNNIAESIFAQMAREPHPVPRWIVCGAGTGGTSATIGRFARYNRFVTGVCVADPAGSVFHRHWADRSVARVDHSAGCIEGIGRQRVEPSFLPDIIDRMEIVEDIHSIAAAHEVSARLGRSCGGSTGTKSGPARVSLQRWRNAARKDRSSIL